MTFQFRIWPIHDIQTGLVPRARPVRGRLVARWQRGTDGRLECRWSRAAD